MLTLRYHIFIGISLLLIFNPLHSVFLLCQFPMCHSHMTLYVQAVNYLCFCWLCGGERASVDTNLNEETQKPHNRWCLILVNPALVNTPPPPLSFYITLYGWKAPITLSHFCFIFVISFSKNRAVIESHMQQSASNILVATQYPNIETQFNPQEFHHPLKFTVRHIFFLFSPYVFCSLAYRIRVLHVQRKVGNRDIRPEIDILQTDFALFPRAPCMTLWLPKAFSERASKISCQHSSLIEPNIAQFVLKSVGEVSFLFLFIFFGRGNCSLWWPDAINDEAALSLLQIMEAATILIGTKSTNTVAFWSHLHLLGFKVIKCQSTFL